jgi:DNA-binding NtrC family response regulator
LFNQEILIVDDNIAVSTMVRFALQDKYSVSTARSAVNAFKYLSNNKVDLILLDIKMPHINGIEALEEIKKTHPEVVVIMMTSYASNENKVKAKMLGAYGFITKPFDVAKLRKYIDRVFSQKVSINSGD